MSRLPGSYLLLLTICSLAACGQKGPLYLPGDPSEVQTEIPEIETDTLPGAGEDDEPATDD